MLRRRLLAGALIELLGKIAARRREGANGFEKCVAVRDPLRAASLPRACAAAARKQNSAAPSVEK